MAARERHVGRIVGRAGAALQLGDCRATGRGHLAHKGHTDALHVCSGWRRILRCPLDMIIRAVKKLISTSVFGCPWLYFFDLPGEQTSRAASRRGVLSARHLAKIKAAPGPLVFFLAERTERSIPGVVIALCTC